MTVLSARSQSLLLLFSLHACWVVISPWWSCGIGGWAPVSILLSWFKRLWKLLTGAATRNREVLGNTALRACLLVSGLWGCISSPLVREPAFSEWKQWRAMKYCKGSSPQLQMCLNNGSIQHTKALWSQCCKIYPLLFCCVKVGGSWKDTVEGMHKFSSDKSGTFVTVCGLVWFFFFFSLSDSPKLPCPYLAREIGVSHGRFEVAWLGMMECQGGHGYFPGAANNFKFSLGMMPGWRDFSSTETHGWLPLDFLLSAWEMPWPSLRSRSLRLKTRAGWAGVR